MKTVIRIFGAIVLAAYVSMAGISCQKETNVETPEGTVDVPVAASGIHVTVGAGIVDTKSAVVTENGVRTLTFTAGDGLYVSGSITINEKQCKLSGTLAIASIGSDCTTATFSGNLKLQEINLISFDPATGPVFEYNDVDYDFGDSDPLAACASCKAILVHEGTTLTGDRYASAMAATVEELMTTCLMVSGNYDASEKSFSLAVGESSSFMIANEYPIFNCTIDGGLAPDTAYDLYLLAGINLGSGNESLLGSITADADGKASFACYAKAYSQERYYAFRFKDGDNWKLAELGQKSLTSKIYNVTRTAVDDPSSPIKPTVTGTDGQWNPDLSVYYMDVADITISGTSKGYYFNLFAGGVVHLDNLSASDPVNPFLYSQGSDMYIELSGNNSISAKSNSCIVSYGNIRLSCAGTSATLSVTYDGAGCWGIQSDNYEHEPLADYNTPGADPYIVSDFVVPELAETGYSVVLTTVQNCDGTWTTTYTVTHTGLLSAEFVINGNFDKVRFSQGNLRYLSTQAVSNGTGTWSFAPNQYSIIGNAENNTDPTLPEVGKSMDLFCWGATGIVDMLGGDPVYPDVNPENTTYYYYTGDNTLSGIYEWGNVAISNTTLTNNGSEKWRTLTKEEWEYLFSNSAKYGPATVAECAGVVLLPDSFSDPNKNGGSRAFVSVSQKTGATYNDNVYSAENWKAMEYAGAVFLPAGGSFLGGDFNHYLSGDMGYYWTSTPNTNGNTKAYYFALYHNVCEVRSGDTNSGDSDVYRSSRLSVRLVRSVE